MSIINPAWISNHVHYKVWDETTYPSPNFNSCTVEVWEWISNFIPHFIMDMITYPCWDSNYYHISQGPGSYQFWLLLCLQIFCYRMLAVNMPKQGQNQTRISPIQVNYINPGYGLSLVDTLWNASLYRQPLEQEGNPMTWIEQFWLQISLIVAKKS